MEVEDDDKAVELFINIGLDVRTATNTIANKKITSNLLSIIHQAGVTNGCERAVGNLIYTVATKFPANALVHRETLLRYIVTAKIKTPVQLEAAFTFLSIAASDDLNVTEFEESCGVGMEVTLADTEKSVDEIFEDNKNTIIEQRYRTKVGELITLIRKKQPWADPKIVKKLIDAKLYALLGERTAADDEKPVKKKKEKPGKVEEKDNVKFTPLPKHTEEELNPFAIFPSPEDNYKVHTEIFFSDRPVLRASNSKKTLAKHLQETGGKVLTRFPPEPNGYLHIGHAKALFVNFGLAKERHGGCYLRYDDTNPEAEKNEYIDHIEEIVKWMGWEPFKLCSLEFETRRNSYYWLLDALGLYQPYVWEYSRLNVTNTVMSKRKLKCLVTEKWVDGWDDPRLMTLAGLRRRGFTPTSMNAFVRGTGITRSDCTMIRLDLLEHHVREELNKTSPRQMVVVDPLKVVITNMEAGPVMNLDAKKWPDLHTDDPSYVCDC